ncbi:hypothetical protein [Bacillus sp. B15-48]|uniref:hypothetical protein n=1 Tax=Bacillus sp. B15-48 TaxID=1548601 RepID=UPI00193F58B7|nr:hypothetical protein [Bacillus sp. B15-48]MBM4762724.1 hypothetical protein [Bacillus sp. B15-48]
MKPSFRDQLNEWNKTHRVSTPKKKKRRQNEQKPKLERLSESDIKSLMGMGNRGLRRGKGGAWK